MDKYFFAILTLIIISISVVFYIKLSARRSSLTSKYKVEDSDDLANLKADDFTLLE